MKKVGLYFLFLLFSVVEVRAAQEAVVIEVRKNTNLSKKEKVFKNFFINGGLDLGLQAGTHVDVVRRLPVHDPLKNASIGDLRVKVGTLEIIHAEGKISVARLVGVDSMAQRPLLDYEAVMVGDRLDLSSLRLAPGEVQEAQQQSLELEQKVALLRGQSRAERLIQEGERHLANLEMKTKAEGQTDVASTSAVVARAPKRVPASESVLLQKSVNQNRRTSAQKAKALPTAQRTPSSSKQKSSRKKSNQQG